MGDKMIVIERYTIPTRYDLAPFGTIYRNGEDYFIQLSKDPESSYWITLGVFLEKVLGGSSMTDEFLQECLKLYENKVELREINSREVQ